MQIRGNKYKNKGNNKNLYILVVLLLFLSACGGGGGSGSSAVSTSGSGAIAFSVAWEPAETKRHAAGLVQPLATELDCQDVGVTTVDAKVYDENGTLLATGGPWPCDQHAGTIEGVTAGPNRKVAILGKMGNDIMYRGEAAHVTVTDGDTTDILEPITATNFVPGNLSPTDGASFSSSGTDQASVTLQCNAVPGASTYHFLIATNQGFTSNVQEIIESTGIASVSLDAGTYYWQVSVTDAFGNQGGWSEILSISVHGSLTSALTGTVVDASTAAPISGVTISLDNGAQTTVTNSDGQYNFESISTGTHELSASKNGYITESEEIIISDETQQTVNFTLSRVIDNPGEYRAVLNWGEFPSDLDSHMYTPDGFHIYFGDSGSETSPPYTQLDVDDTSSHGPETITIFQAQPGIYKYSVNNFTGDQDGPLENSEATVKLYNESGLVREWSVPNGNGLWWNVFTLDGSTGQINDVNSISDTSQ
jgi:carboxypeptidase family protein